jgi:hypothetical protein
MMDRIKKFERFVEHNLSTFAVIAILISLTVLFVQADAVMNPTKTTPGGEWSPLFLLPFVFLMFEKVE